MATYVNTPGDGNNNGAGGWIIAIVVIIVLVLLALFLFPNLFAGSRDDNNLEVTVPAETTPAPNPQPSVINNTFNSTTTVSTTSAQ